MKSVEENLRDIRFYGKAFAQNQGHTSSGLPKRKNYLLGIRDVGLNPGLNLLKSVALWYSRRKFHGRRAWRTRSSRVRRSGMTEGLAYTLTIHPWKKGMAAYSIFCLDPGQRDTENT